MTSPKLLWPLRTEATARHQLECQRAGVAYPEPKRTTQAESLAFARQPYPHADDGFIDPGCNPPGHGWAWAIGLACGAVTLGVGLAAVWPW